MKKNSFFILFIGLFFIFCSTTTLATSAPSERPLEITYPAVPNATTPTTVATPIPEYVKYLYYFFLVVTGFFAVGALFYGGFRYITSAGSPEAMKDAKDQILAAILGLLILFSSWLILYQLSPQLVIFNIGPLRPSVPTLTPGILLCKEQVAGVVEAWNAVKESQNLNQEYGTASASRKRQIIERLQQISIQVSSVIASTTKICWQVPASGDIPDPYNDNVKWVYLIPMTATTTAPSLGPEYGVILYEKTKFSGRTLAFYTFSSSNPQASAWDQVEGQSIADLKPSSVRPFILNYYPQPRPVWYVNLYELVDYNKADPEKWKKEDVSLPSTGDPASSDTTGSSQKLGSLRIEGEYIVVFFKEGASSENSWWKGDIDVFTESDTNLYDNLMGTWCGTWPLRNPCAPGGLVVISAEIY